MLTTGLPVTKEDFDRDADAYKATLTCEDIMEIERTGTQRGITLSLFRLLQDLDPRVVPFNELLVQYFRDQKLKRIVPDNMLLVTSELQEPRRSFAVPRESVRPFMTVEYVSDESEEKDYATNLDTYAYLGVAYYVIFDADRSYLEVYHLSEQGEYVRLEPDLNGRVAVPELDLQICVLDGWMRFWHQGELLELPEELKRTVADRDVKLAAETAKVAERDAKLAERDANLAAEKAKVAERDAKLAAEKAKVAERDAKLAAEMAKVAESNSKLATEKEKVAERDSQLATMTDFLRQSITKRAQERGRQDVLQQLPTADVAQLYQWMNEI